MEKLHRGGRQGPRNTAAMDRVAPPNSDDPAEADGETFRDIICRLQETNDRLQASVDHAREGEDRALHGYTMEGGRRLQAETERDAALEPVAEEDWVPVGDGAFDAAGPVAVEDDAASDNEGFHLEGAMGPDVVEDWGDKEISPRNQMQIYDYYNDIHPHLARMAQVLFFLPRLEGAERETRRLQTTLEINRRASRTTYQYNRALETTFRHCDDFARAEWRSFTEVGDEVPETLQQWTESLHRTQTTRQKQTARRSGILYAGCRRLMTDYRRPWIMPGRARI